MKICLTTPLVDFDGETLQVRTQPHERAAVLTLKAFLLTILLAPHKASLQEHMDREMLARKIHLEKDEIELSEHEVNLVLHYAGDSGFSSIAVAQVIRALRGTDV